MMLKTRLAKLESLSNFESSLRQNGALSSFKHYLQMIKQPYRPKLIPSTYTPIEAYLIMTGGIHDSN